MHERMLDKAHEPSEKEIKQNIGKKASAYIARIQKALQGQFDINTKLKFPFGNRYGWGHKYSHKTKHLFYTFYEKGSFTFSIQVDGQQAKKGADLMARWSPEGKKRWQKRYPCGTGGWVHYRVLNNTHFKDIGLFLMTKTGKKFTW
jgi:hypothetical protein